MKTWYSKLFPTLLFLLLHQSIASAQCPTINGTWGVCRNTSTTTTFYLSNPPAVAYTWSAGGGTIISGQGTTALVVNFPAGLLPYNGQYFTISVNWLQYNGCWGSVTHIVNSMVIPPSPLQGPINASCANSTGNVYWALGNAGLGPTHSLSYSFYVTGGTITQQWYLPVSLTDVHYFVRVNWGAGPVGKIKWCVTNSQPGYNSCTYCDSVNINLLGPNPGAGVNLGPDISACSFPQVLNAGSGYLSYVWSNNQNTQTISVSAPGTYSVTVAEPAGCSTDAVVVTNGNPVVNIVLSGPANFCQGDTVTLDAGTGTSWQSYLWNTGANTQTINVSSGGTYSVTVTTQGGCTGSDNQIVNVYQTALAITSNNAATLCPGGAGAGTTTLTASAGFASYLWSNGATTPSITVNSPGTYTVTGTNPAACINTASVVVNAFTACNAPGGMNASNLLSTSATLNWNAAGCANKYRIYYRPLGTNAWTQVIVNAPATSATISGLNNLTTYEWRMRTMCLGGGASPFSPTFTFSTPFKMGEPPAGVEIVEAHPLLYPNPNEGNFTLEYFSETTTEMEICIYDLFGKRIRCENKVAEEGENRWQMNFSELPEGVYLLRAGEESMRFVIGN